MKIQIKNYWSGALLFETDAETIGAAVLSGEGKSRYGGNRINYAKGKKMKPDSFDPNPLKECSHGIHFFITKAEAEAYND